MTFFHLFEFLLCCLWLFLVKFVGFSFFEQEPEVILRIFLFFQ